MSERIIVNNQGIIDAFDTTSSNSTEFLDISVSPAAVVPVPAAVWLFLSAIVGLFGLSSFQARAAAKGDSVPQV